MTKKIILAIIIVLLFGFSTKTVLAQKSQSTLYVPLIGLTAVPDPLTLPKGEGNVTYHYAVKNFLQEVPLTDINIVDNKCPSIKFVEGDENNNSMLDYNETWRYTCSTQLSKTTQNTARVTAKASGTNITATQRAYATVIVGSNTPPPMVSIVNISKIAFPLSLAAEGGKVTFTYKVNNPGIVPLSDVTITDNNCHAMSNKVGDTNDNNLLDINEVWIYSCTMAIKETTTNTVKVAAFANGLKAVADGSITVNVDAPLAQPTKEPNLPNTGNQTISTIKIIVWTSLIWILLLLITIFFLKKHKQKKSLKISEL